jgi:acetyl esterase/lipase
MASRTLRSPLGYGFVLGAAFSRAGRQLAVFVNYRPQDGGQPAEMAIASTEPGTVRLVPAVRLTPLNAGSRAGPPPAILVTNGFDPLRDVGNGYAQKLAAPGSDLTYMHNPDLTHGFPQFTRSSAACHQATLDLADLIKSKIG